MHCDPPPVRLPRMHPPEAASECPLRPRPRRGLGNDARAQPFFLQNQKARDTKPGPKLVNPAPKGSGWEMWRSGRLPLGLGGSVLLASLMPSVVGTGIFRVGSDQLSQPRAGCWYSTLREDGLYGIDDSMHLVENKKTDVVNRKRSTTHKRLRFISSSLPTLKSILSPFRISGSLVSSMKQGLN